MTTWARILNGKVVGVAEARTIGWARRALGGFDVRPLPESDHGWSIGSADRHFHPLPLFPNTED
jgi:hypothetical protein